ncbi:YHS domain-containing protein [Weeksellaceae bacterium A-14]|uniref:YHS domain-containing protein n=1 Tax=Daejeonia sp. YH14 TaxID=3439042 RepID=UPI0031E4B339
MKHYYIYTPTVFLSFLLSCSKEPQVKPMKKATAAIDVTHIKVVNEEDPVCHMKTAEYLKDTAVYKGQVYGFCSSHCKDEFKKQPENYLK